METNKDDFSLIHIKEDSSDCKNIEQLIVNVRGRQVMLDRDLASLYGVETKALNQAVKRNIERFPDDFRFQLTKDECLRSQIVTFKYLPYAFTENGIAMLSSVLRSQTQRHKETLRLCVFVTLRLYQSCQSLLPRRNIVKKLKTQSRRDSETQRNFKTLRLCDFASLLIKPIKSYFDSS